MVDLIHTTYADRVTLQTLGTALRGKPEHLGRLFQAVVGVSVHEYVTRVRLEQAAHLIRSGLKIEAVALGVGYRSKKNFYRQFIRHYAVTPEAFRRRRAEPRSTSGTRATVRAVHTNGLATYGGSFDETACVIEVEVRPNVMGRPSFVAIPYVIANHGIQPFAASSDYIEIPGETELDAVERAAIFLEHRFGPRNGNPKKQHNHKHAPPILAPRT